jgi:hypothetical protein
MSGMSRWVIFVAATAGVVIFLGGCGDSGTNVPLSQIDLGRETLARCLQHHGAQFATETRDLSFFDRAEASDTASMFATYLDNPTKLFVQMWQDGDDPRDWLMWQAQPFDENKTPAEIVEAVPSKSYVAYTVNPSNAERRALEACTAG